MFWQPWSLASCEVEEGGEKEEERKGRREMSLRWWAGRGREGRLKERGREDERREQRRASPSQLEIKESRAESIRAVGESRSRRAAGLGAENELRRKSRARSFKLAPESAERAPALLLCSPASTIDNATASQLHRDTGMSRRAAVELKQLEKNDKGRRGRKREVLTTCDVHDRLETDMSLTDLNERSGQV